ncbi:hypothetical protein BDU57DRAFT_185094 [Ampelomyces quisqualis]|uniref:SCP domain-containing protein n=1 Tax=Ampelomyces quisqualis TaxID=50730 RepID=A0A6A5QQX4_AMPQU|nr:hypothetical protein BDU57DRAFT_185094 [Ampelomyces quisqualis]
MRAAFAIATLAGSAIAAPSYGGYAQKEEVKNVHVVVETVVKTVYLTEGYEVPAPTPSPVYEAPAAPTTTSVYETPKPTQVQKEAKPTTAEVYKADAPAPIPETPKADGYMGVINEWRGKMGMASLVHDAQLESNAKDVVVSGAGQMVHKLNPGSYAQVLAPGEPGVESFTKVFVGGWLCEMATLPGLNGVCQQMSQGWAYEGQTGHAEILTSPNYSKIACAEHQGIWCCDLA